MFTHIFTNPLVLTDAYNFSHQAFKVNTDFEVSHIYNRSKGMILYGFHELVVTFLSNIVITHELIEEASRVAERMNILFPKEMWKRIPDELAGKIPLLVESLPEGTYCPPGTPFAQISNTVSGFGELVTWWEAVFLHAYFPASCATEALEMRRYLEKVQQENNFPPEFLARFHSFGFRGHRSLGDAYWAGSAWALFLHGSDDVHISMHHRDANLTSIPALAHKVVQTFDVEYDCFVRAIDVVHEQKGNIVALVIDTYDTYNVIRNMVAPLAEYAKGKNIHLVFRPDSGQVEKQAVDIYDIVLEHGYTNVSVIIGESMSLTRAKELDEYFTQNNVPLTFISYGIGAGFYKHIDRDYLGWAMKTAYSNGKPRMKFSENPLKRSTPGKVVLYKDEKNDLVVDNWDAWKENGEKDENLLEKIYFYDNGSVNAMKVPTLEETRTRALRESTVQKYVKNTVTVKNMIRDFKLRYKTGDFPRKPPSRSGEEST
jgi:nicotinamide phosphoribosyltransferase